MTITPRMREFFRFCLVGGIGFVVDAGLTLGLQSIFGIRVTMTRILAIFIALQVTYWLHSFFTFRHHTARTVRGWSKFMVCNLAGACVNYTVFWCAGEALTALLVRLDWFANEETMFMASVAGAIAAGTAAGLAFNYWANRRFVFGVRVS